MSEEEVDFVSGCPIAGCPKALSACYWRHYLCDEYEKINSYGNVRCYGGDFLGCFVQLKYKCDSGHHSFEGGDWDNFNIAISILFKMKNVSRDFKKKLREVIDKEFPNY